MNADLETQIIELNNNPAFCALREKFAQDTIFDILGATNRELVNSRFFAWLLDPNGFHNLGTKGVEKLFECIYIKSENKEKKNLLKGFLLGKNAIKNVIVRCEESFKNKKTKEKSRFDIFINIEYKDKDKEDEILKIIIENKYDAPESPEQTKKYEELLKEERSDNIKTIGIFLSAHADEAKSPEFINISYEDFSKYVISPIEKISKLTCERANIFIKEYLQAQKLNIAFEGVDDEIRKILTMGEKKEYQGNEVLDNFINNNRLLLSKWLSNTTKEEFKYTKHLIEYKDKGKSAGSIVKNLICEKLKSFNGESEQIEKFTKAITANNDELCQFQIFSPTNEREEKKRYYAKSIPELPEFKDIKGIEELKDYYFTNHWFEKDIEKMRKWLDEYRPSK